MTVSLEGATSCHTGLWASFSTVKWLTGLGLYFENQQFYQEDLVSQTFLTVQGPSLSFYIFGRQWYGYYRHVRYSKSGLFQFGFLNQHANFLLFLIYGSVYNLN